LVRLRLISENAKAAQKQCEAVFIEYLFIIGSYLGLYEYTISLQNRIPRLTQWFYLGILLSIKTTTPINNTIMPNCPILLYNSLSLS